MNVLGLFGLGMNPGACLLRDGELVGFAEEERFTRQKGSHGMFPGHAATWCLKRGGIPLDGVDRIAFAWDAEKYPLRMFATLGWQYLRHRRRVRGWRGSGEHLRRAHAARSADAMGARSGPMPGGFGPGRSGPGGPGRGGSGAGRRPSSVRSAFDNVMRHRPGNLRQEIHDGLRAHGHKVHAGSPPIEFIPHHLCHSYSAYFCSPFQRAVVLTLDGSGEDVCTQVAIGRDNLLEVVDSVPIPHSLGWFYAAFTSYLGFTPYRDEGKFMGLAAMGHARAANNPWPERLDRILPLTSDGYEVDPIYTRLGKHSFDDRFTDALADFVTSFDPRLAPIAGRGCNATERAELYLNPAYVDLAFGVQARLEAVVRELVDRAIERYGIRDVCIAGGVGLNCKMNGAVLAGTAAERVFVQPASYDAGTAIGAAMVVAEAAGDPIRNRLDHAYYGPSFTNDEIRTCLKRTGLGRAGVEAAEVSDVSDRVAEELERGRVVGWFQGPLELGPRALGARSILANPAVPGMRDRLNLQVKAREAWRPFCPSILAEAAPEYFKGSASTPFMTTAFEVLPGKRREMRQAMHVDGTARPQSVTPVLGGRYHRVLERFRDRTGQPFVINTSFNVNGEPIVRSPADALASFQASDIDVLALGDYVLTKT